MARIPTSDELGQPIVSGASPTGIDGEDIAAMKSPGAAIGGLGDQVASLGDRLDKQNDINDEYEMRKRFVDFDLQQEQKLSDLQRTAPDNPAGLTQAWRQGYDQDAKTFFSDVPDTQKPKYDYMLVHRGAQYQGSVQNFEDTRRDQYYLNDLDTQTQGLRDAVTKDPTTLNANIARGAFLIDAANLAYPAREKAKKTFASSIAEDAIRTRLGNGEDPETIINDIQKAPVSAGTGALDTANSPDYRAHSNEVASVRTNNPGAMIPNDIAAKFGATDSQTLPNGDKIAVFPDAVSGAAAQVAVLSSDQYAGKTLGAAVKTWSGNHGVSGYLGVIKRDTGLDASTVLTPEMLRDPEVAIPLAKAMATQEAGKPYPLSDQEWQRGFNKANGIGDDGDVKVAQLAPAGSPQADQQIKDDADVANGEAAPSPYRFLNPVQRRTLVNVVREAGRANALDSIKNDVAQIKNTGNPTLLPDGRTSLEKAQQLLTPKQYREASDQWHEAELEHAAIAPLANMSEDEAHDHIGNFVPEEGAGDYATRVKVAGKADKALTQIITARKKDPALAVEKTPEVQQAFGVIKQLRQAPNAVDGGTIDASPLISPQKANGLLIDARIAAQRRLGLTDGEQSPVTRRQAMDLIQIPDFKAVSDTDLPKQLRAARDRADAMYGPQYSKLVFEKSLAMLSKDKRVSEASTPIIRKMLDGEAPNQEDFSRSDGLARASVSDNLFNPEDIGPGAIFRAPMPGSFPTQSPATPGGLLSSGTNPRDGAFNKAKPLITPPGPAVQKLKDDPSLAAQFDAKYGPGQAALALRR